MFLYSESILGMNRLSSKKSFKWVFYGGAYPFLELDRSWSLFEHTFCQNVLLCCTYCMRVNTRVKTELEPLGDLTSSLCCVSVRYGASEFCPGPACGDQPQRHGSSCGHLQCAGHRPARPLHPVCHLL